MSRARWPRSFRAGRSTARVGVLALVLLGATGPAAAEERFDCVIDPPLVVKVGSAVSGLLEAVTIRRGDAVRAGQVIARLGSSVEQATVDLLTVRVRNVAAIEAQRARLAFIEARLGRIRQLQARGVATVDALDEIEAERITSASLLAMAEMEQELAEKELARAKAALEIREIRSPIDGIVVERRLSAGEFVHQEGHVATIVQLAPLHVETFLPVERYGQVALGDVVTVVPAAPITGMHQAKVIVVDQVFDAASGTFGVQLEMANPGGQLPGGHRCQVVFPFEPAS